MLLNNDTLVTPSLLEDLLKGYESLDKPGAVSPLIMHHPETDKIWFSEAIWTLNWKKGEVGFALTNGKSLETLEKNPPYESMFACGCCLFVSSAVVKEIGLFDERYFAFFDEAEWCARMRKKGYRSYIVPTARMFHKVGSTIPNLVMTYLMSRNSLLWMKDNLPAGLRLRSWGVVMRNMLWHWRNVKGWIPKERQYCSVDYSRVALKGLHDFRKGKFGKWDEETAKLLFRKTGKPA
jgi:GT2 family glycosyltransferase